MTERETAPVRKRIEIQGVVQGVGFRPFVYRIAKRFDIRGWVLNSSAGVVIEAEGGGAEVAGFLVALKDELPPLARIDRFTLSDQPSQGDAEFVIEDSVAVAAASRWSRPILPPASIASAI